MEAARIAGASPDDLLLTELEVQDEFGIGIRFLRKCRHESAGEGPPVTRIGRNCRYRRGGVREWQREQESGSGVSCEVSLDDLDVWRAIGDLAREIVAKVEAQRDGAGA